MRLPSRFYTPFISLILTGFFTLPAQASSGIAFSMENLYAGLGKRSQLITLNEADEIQGPFVNFGRETTEWLGFTAYTDLNKNWRVLYGAHVTWLGFPLFKFDASLAYLLDMPKELPLQPYFFLGATPVFSAGNDENISRLSLTAQAGIGVDYSWNESLFTSLRINTYLLNHYNDGNIEDNSQLSDRELDWVPISFSLSFSTGVMF